MIINYDFVEFVKIPLYNLDELVEKSIHRVFNHNDDIVIVTTDSFIILTFDVDLDGNKDIYVRYANLKSKKSIKKTICESLGAKILYDLGIIDYNVYCKWLKIEIENTEMNKWHNLDVSYNKYLELQKMFGENGNYIKKDGKWEFRHNKK